MEILPGKLVFEVKPAGINKGNAVCELMSYAPFTGRNGIEQLMLRALTEGLDGQPPHGFKGFF